MEISIYKVEEIFQNGLNCYYGINDTKQDVRRALGYFLEAKKQYNIQAIDRLCDIYRDGIGVDIDLEKTFEYNEMGKTLANDYVSRERFKIRGIGIKKNRDKKR